MPVSDATLDAEPDLAVFLKTLAEEGRALVFPGPLAEGAESAREALRQCHAVAGRELALEAPAFSPPAAMWAARLFYDLCRFTLCRDIGEAEMAVACSRACPEPRGPETDWSADLTLRHLPKLFPFARHLSQADPLVQQIKQIAAAWPLSSVGIPGLEQRPLDSFLAHPALARLYADRIVSANDLSRLGDPRVDELLRADLGIHHDLAPAIAARLYPDISPPLERDALKR
jgi:hypothetical protein